MYKILTAVPLAMALLIASATDASAQNQVYTTHIDCKGTGSNASLRLAALAAIQDYNTNALQAIDNKRLSLLLNGYEILDAGWTGNAKTYHHFDGKQYHVLITRTAWIKYRKKKTPPGGPAPGQPLPR